MMLALPPLQVLHEDPEFVVVEKPGGVLAVPGRGPQKQACVARQILDAYPGCIAQPSVHRLDMDTSGLMVFARSRECHAELSRQFREQEVRKEYIALLDGVLTGSRGTIELRFRLDVDHRPIQIHDDVHGKLGITHWENLGIEEGRTRIRFRPVTGRTHQLRLHAADRRGLGIPIVGDPFYGTGTGPGQLRLHASLLAFRHPSSHRSAEFRSAPGF
jgi:tRNA pseudouridine32 synthase/23S rRNA pseudouridine746 synthase